MKPNKYKIYLDRFSLAITLKLAPSCWEKTYRIDRSDRTSQPRRSTIADTNDSKKAVSLLSRTDLESGLLQKMISQSGLNLHVLSETELQESIRKTLQQQKPDSDVWLFAYGSLIWNPIFRFTLRRVGTVRGLHRRFCLWTPLGRGTPDNPGLVLGLDRGGSCRGIIYRIAAADVPSELLLVWRREMVVGSYIPTWVRVSDGTQEVKAIAFVVNRRHPGYAGNVSFETTVDSIATAGGRLGSCADYLLQTVSGLTSAGIRDKQLLLLRDRVLERQTSKDVPPERLY